VSKYNVGRQFGDRHCRSDSADKENRHPTNVAWPVDNVGTPDTRADLPDCSDDSRLKVHLDREP